MTKRDSESLVMALDQKVSDSEIKWKTAANIWSTYTTMFGEACASKNLWLRCREDNPARDVKPPDRGARRARTFLYPTEFLALMNCDAVPVHRRRLYALATYFYGRCAEIEALAWSSVHLDQGTFQIHQAMDRAEKGDVVKATKMEDVRDLLLEPNIVPLLNALHKETGGKGRVVARHPHPSELASAPPSRWN